MHMTDGSKKAPDFYVGYLGLPSRHKRFLRKLMALLVIGMVGIGGGVGWSQRNPGKTEVFSSAIATWSGTVFVEPYPMMVHDDGSIHLLIGIGKFGVADRVLEFDGRHCEVDGWALARSDRRAIQLDLAENSIREIAGAARPYPVEAHSDSEQIELIGEIVDGKCFLGAMKPGDGKAHKSCATLCIEGGLPAMFVSDARLSLDQLPLVVVDGSTGLPDRVLGLVGEPVRVTGSLSFVGTLPILSFKSDDVERWSGDLP